MQVLYVACRESLHVGLIGHELLIDFADAAGRSRGTFEPACPAVAAARNIPIIVTIGKPGTGKKLVTGISWN